MSDRMIIGRLGGEEFAILLEGSSREAAIEIAEGLRVKMAALAFDTVQARLSLTCSFGVSEWEQGENIDQLLKRADAALYEAKTSGRNRVVAARASTAETESANGSGVVRLAGRGATADQDEPPPAAANGVHSFPATAFVLDDESQIAALVCKGLA